MDDNTRQQKRSWDRPEGASFEDWMKSRVARVADRPYDWNALKFQADFDPKYRRAFGYRCVVRAWRGGAVTILAAFSPISGRIAKANAVPSRPAATAPVATGSSA